MIEMILSLMLQTAKAAPVDEMGVKLIALRAEVEDKGRELQEAQRESSSEIDSFLQRKNELEGQLRKEHIRSLQLAEKSKFLKSDFGKTKSAGRAEYEPLLAWTKRLEEAIRDSLPFRKTERIAALQGLRSRVEAGRENPVSLASELWTFTEKELKLTADNEYVVGKVDLNGSAQEAEIARLGMIQMVFKTAQGDYGYAVRENSGWKLAASSSSVVRDSVGRTLKKFKERQSSGWFEVPGLDHLIKRSE